MNRMSRLSHRTGTARTALLDDRRCILYIRGSTTDQQNTLQAQEFEGRAWAERQGLTIVAVFIDSGQSGAKPLLDRPEARKALAMMKKDGISTFVVLCLDRAFRNPVDMHLTIEHLLDAGHNFRMISQDLDIRGPVGRMVAGILAELAKFELSCRSERQMRGFDAMRRSLIARSQHAPFGWEIGAEIPGKTAHSGKPYRQLIVNPDEQKILREILALYERKESLQAIADMLNDRNIPTKRAGQTMHRRGTAITISGKWKPQNVKCVIAHAELAEKP